MRKWIFFTLLLAIPAAVQTTQAGDSPVRPKSINPAPPVRNSDTGAASNGQQKGYYSVLADYRGYYAEREPLCFTSITAGPSGAYGLRIAFDSNMPGFRHVEMAEGQKGFRVLKDNVLFVPLDEKLDVEQNKSYRVRPVFAGAEKSTVYTIHINCMTRKAFEKLGGKRKVDVIKVSSEPRMSFGTNRPEDWRSSRPNESEIAFARKQWGQLLQGVTSDYEKAKILTKALIRELAGHGGLPKAFLYDLPTFEKYVAITSGKSGHACGQYSEIFSMACNSFGVINRRGFIHDGLKTEDVIIELGSSHLSAEIFDRQLNQWIFIDGRYNALGAYLGNIGPLTMHEFFLFMNQPYRRTNLNILYYDAANDREQMMPVDKCSKPFNAYLGWTKGFYTAF